jgi:AcrR family transcriptional regulator
LIDAAEVLFAKKGLDAVSLRQVAAAIGSANPTVVSYHFGSKEEFINAIYQHRLPGIDARRAELLAQADAEYSEQDLMRLIQMLCLPLFELVDADGWHSYGQFVFRMLSEGMGPDRMPLAEPFPATRELIRRIRAQLSLSAEGLNLRLRITAAMMFEVLRIIDAPGTIERSPDQKRQIFDDVLAMCVAALRESAVDR